jgi:hypothetical protein
MARRGTALAVNAPLILLAILTVFLSASGEESISVWLFAGVSFLAGIAYVPFTIGVARVFETDGRRCLFDLTVLLGLIVSVPVTNWPLRATFWLSRSAIEQLADAVERGEDVTFPHRAGLFQVQVGGRRSEQTFLWLDPHLGGPRGFVKAPANEPPWFNLWSSISLGENWYLIQED